MDTLRSVRDTGGNLLTNDEVVCYSMYGFAGSCSYMGRLVGFMLYELLHQPELLTQVREEVDGAFAQGIRDATDIRNLRLLQAVYHETLRYHPVSQGLPFYAERDFEYAGKRIRKGDITVLSQVPMSFSECPFRNAEVFDPSRCLEPRSEHRRERAFHPFGMGGRTCTAMGLVELMAVSMAATLVHELRFDQSPPDYRLKLAVKPLPAPDAGFRIWVEGPREPTARPPVAQPMVEEEVLASFPGVDDPVVREALATAEIRRFPAGAEIIREGDAADGFHVVLQGGAVVTRNASGPDQILARLTEGAYFGEIGLLQDIPRTATVTADEYGAETLVLGREAFLQVVATSDLVTEDLARIVRKRLVSQRVMEAWTGLSPQNLERVMSDFAPRTYAPGELIIREGDAAEHFFILIEGEVVISREARSGTEEEVARLGPGEYFGEIGLIYRGPRRATVTTARSGPATVLVTDRAGFQKLLGETGGVRAELARAMLGRIKKLAQHRS
jgi:CRP-like cAMP-binding protein